MGENRSATVCNRALLIAIDSTTSSVSTYTAALGSWRTFLVRFGDLAIYFHPGWLDWIDAVNEHTSPFSHPSYGAGVVAVAETAALRSYPSRRCITFCVTSDDSATTVRERGYAIPFFFSLNYSIYFLAHIERIQKQFETIQNTGDEGRQPHSWRLYVSILHFNSECVLWVVLYKKNCHEWAS